MHSTFQSLNQTSKVASNSIRYYDQNRERFFEEYSSHNAEDIHGVWARKHLDLGNKPSIACDIGAGSGRDANWLAEKGFDVVAVEPSKLREVAEPKSHSNVTWLKASLPDLKQLTALGQRFDLILLNGVWQHLKPSDYDRAFRKLSNLLNPSGLLIISIRQGGSLEERRTRGFHDIDTGAIRNLATKYALRHHEQINNQRDLKRDDICWDFEIFEMPSDATGNLPVLRHIIVNDQKSSTYKLGLLRTLVKLAETAPGVVSRRTDDYVEIPFGAVGLYWIRLYWPLLLGDQPIVQTTHGRSGFAKKNAFGALKRLSQLDLSFGATFTQDRARIVSQAIRDACANIRKQPMHYITYPGEPGKQIFELSESAVRSNSDAISLTPDYLSKFGTLRMPATLWDTLGQYACWLDPAIVFEWRQLLLTFKKNHNLKALPDDGLFLWNEAIRDTSLVRVRTDELIQQGFPLTCIWSDKTLHSTTKFEIDHCIPWRRWPNNDLWNLLPTLATVNQQKGDLLPRATKLDDARQRMLDWWQVAWLDGPKQEQFFIQASYALPGLTDQGKDLTALFRALKHQRRRLRTDQLIPEWPSVSAGLSDSQAM